MPIKDLWEILINDGENPQLKTYVKDTLDALNKRLLNDDQLSEAEKFGIRQCLIVLYNIDKMCYIRNKY